MANLTKQQWAQGWVPTQDDINGNPEGLLRMDNLQQDSLGALTNARGAQAIVQEPWPQFIAAIYSKILLGANESIYIGLDQGYLFFRSIDGATNFNEIAAGNGPPAFGDGFGFVFGFAGQTRFKDNGTGTVAFPLGLKVPGYGTSSQGNGPALVAGQSSTLLLFGGGAGGTVEEGTLVGAVLTVDPSTLRGILLVIPSTMDTTTIQGSQSPIQGNDLFSLGVNVLDTTQVISITWDFLLSANLTTPTDYFTYTNPWNAGTGSAGLQGQNQNITTQVARSSFTRVGTDGTLDWTQVQAVRVTVVCSSQISFMTGPATIAGGVNGQLNGVYVYLQVNINNYGNYEAKSPVSAISAPVVALNSTVEVIPIPTIDPAWVGPVGGTPQVQIFRMSISNSTDAIIEQLLTSDPNIPDLLNTFYLVGTVAPNTSFVDNVSDIQALQVNVSPNQFLQSVQDVPGAIIGCEGPYFGLMLYITSQYIYLSDTLNPDAVDSRYTIKAFGDPTEQNLWLKKLTNGVLILGTSKNLYEISGTLAPLPDGTIDAVVIPIGENYPPLSSDVAAANATIFYVAADGIRYTQGSNSQQLSPQLNLLFQGEARFGFPPVAIYPNNAVRYPITVAHGKLFTSLYMQDGTRWLFIYNFVRQTFTVQYTDPSSLFGTQSDRILAGYGAGGSQSFQSNALWELEMSTTGGFYDPSGTLLNGYTLNLLTVCDANQQPRNRKVLFTLKIVADTGGAKVNVFIGVDGQAVQQAGSITSSGISTSFIPLYNFNEPVLNDTGSGNFRIQIQFRDDNLVTTFRLEEVTIEYDPYPEQVNYLVVQPSNFGNYDRKRWTSYAFVIDTLGYEVTFNPIVDGVELTDQSITFATLIKQTVACYFNREVLGTDISGTLICQTAAGRFEYFGPNLEETVSEKLPTPATFLVIPPNNYGTPNRKRHTSYKFQIITRGANVLFTPILDGVSYPPATFNTTTKKTVEYFFTPTQTVPINAYDDVPGDVVAIDIGGTLASVPVDGVYTPFEFYGSIEPQTVEKLPDRLESLRIANTNLDAPTRKRVRTIPIVIDTYGQNVVFTPILDDVPTGPSTILNTIGKRTAYHFFINDVFPTDVGGFLSGGAPFEFYGLGQFEDVEVLPVPKKYDQLGPTRLDKIGKLFGFRIRLISEGDAEIPYQIITDELGTVVPAYGLTDTNPAFSGTIPVVPFVDNIWEVELPKSVNGTIVRLVIGPTTAPFHRYDVQLKVQTSGMESESQWMPIK